MIFTRIGTLVAWIAMLMAAGRFAIGVYAAMQPTEAMREISARYLGSTPAAALDQAAVVFAFAVALGILTEISRAVRAQDE